MNRSLKPLALFVAALWALAGAAWATAWPVLFPDRQACGQAIVEAMAWERDNGNLAPVVQLTAPAQCRGFNHDELVGIVAELVAAARPTVPPATEEPSPELPPVTTPPTTARARPGTTPTPTRTPAPTTPEPAVTSPAPSVPPVESPTPSPTPDPSGTPVPEEVQTP